MGEWGVLTFQRNKFLCFLLTKYRAAWFPLTGAQIRNAVLKAAARAAGRHTVQRQVTQRDLETDAEEEARLISTSKVVGFTGTQGALMLDSRVLCDQQLDKRGKQRFASLSDVVHKLKATQVKREFLL